MFNYAGPMANVLKQRALQSCHPNLPVMVTTSILWSLVDTTVAIVPFPQGNLNIVFPGCDTASS